MEELILQALYNIIRARNPENPGFPNDGCFPENKPAKKKKIADLAALSSSMKAAAPAGGEMPLPDEDSDDEGVEKYFTRDDIGAMTTEEFTKNKAAIAKQLRKVGIPRK